MRTRAFAAVLLLAMSPTLLPATPALAQNDAVTEMARQRFQEGVKFFDGRKYEEARAAFLQAYALKQHPAVLLNLAQSELRSNRPADAARHFAAFLRDNPAASAHERQGAQRGLDEARTKCGRVRVVVDTDGADIFVDGEPVGASPLAEPVDVATGARKVEARQGGHTAALTVTAVAGKTVDASLTVEPVATTPIAPPVPSGSGAPADDVVASPAKVEPANGPAAEPEAPNALRPDDARGDEGTSASSPSSRQPVIPWFMSHPLAWVGSGLAVVGLGVGFIGVAGASSAGSKADATTAKIRNAMSGDEKYANRPMEGFCASSPTSAKYPAGDYAKACGVLRDSLDRQSANKTLATVGFVVAGASAVGTVAYYFLSSTEPANETPASATITPVYGPGFAGMSVAGAF